jgi:hypothetical protein
VTPSISEAEGLTGIIFNPFSLSSLNAAYPNFFGLRETPTIATGWEEIKSSICFSVVIVFD